MKIMSIMFFPNGQTATFDDKGQQVPELQGRHYIVLEKLKKLHINLSDIPEVLGTPHTKPFDYGPNGEIVDLPDPPPTRSHDLDSPGYSHAAGYED